MVNVGRGGGVGGRTHTCLIGEEAALNAVHDAGTAKAAEDGAEIKGTHENLTEHIRQHLGIDDHQHQRHQNVEGTHDGHENTRHRHDALAAAHEAVAHQRSDDKTDDPRSDVGIIKAVGGEGGLEVVGCQHIEADTVGQNQKHGKEDGNALLPLESCLNVVGRAAVAAVLTTLFVDLRQRALHESGSAADNGDDPHPKHAAETAHAQRGGNTDDVARTHAGGGGHHEGLERGHTVAVLLRHGLELLPQQTELGKAGADGEKDAAQYQQNNQHIAV